VPTLMELVGQGHEVIACYTRAPRPAGRGMELRKSPVHEKAEQLGIPVFTPKSLKSEEEQENFASLGADVAVVVAYGLILPKAILDAPVEGCLNLHGSLLPRWRGAAPINRAIMAGDAQTGVMVMKMDEGLDTGPVAMAEIIPITPEMTAGQLHDRMASLGADLMARAVAALSRGALQFTPQADEGVTYAEKIDKIESRIDWTKPAKEVDAHIRGLSPFPGAWCELTNISGKQERLKILKSILDQGQGEAGTVLDDHLKMACGSGAIRILELQKAGKAPMSAETFLRGNRLSAGDKYYKICKYLRYASLAKEAKPQKRN
jgi:methionyl-tRNA formyltransferase